MKTFTLRLAFMTLILLPFFGFAQEEEEEKETRTVGDFDAVNTSSIIDLYLSEGSTNEVRVEVNGHSLSDIETDVRGGTLYLRYDKNNIRSRKGEYVRVYVTYQKLEAVTASGAADVFVENGHSLKAKSFELDLSGSSDFSGKIETEELLVRLSGASDAKVSGSATTQKIRASGSSDYEGYDLKSETAEVRASGASDIHVHVSKTLDAEASGSSDVNYKGSPDKVRGRATGAADINRK